MNAQSTIRAKWSSGSSNKHPAIAYNANPQRILRVSSMSWSVWVRARDSPRSDMLQMYPHQYWQWYWCAQSHQAIRYKPSTLYTVGRGTYARQWQQSLKNIGKEILSQPQVCCEKHYRKEIQNSYTGCTLAMPRLQTILVSQRGTQLSSNICVFEVAKIENYVKTWHFCA